jgi:hypothetical protein
MSELTKQQAPLWRPDGKPPRPEKLVKMVSARVSAVSERLIIGPAG